MGTEEKHLFLHGQNTLIINNMAAPFYVSADFISADYIRKSGCKQVKILLQSGDKHKDHKSLKKQLTADERRFTQIDKSQTLKRSWFNQKGESVLFVSYGFLGVYPFLSAVNCRL